MIEAPRVVFDCNIFLQGIAAPNGPAGRNVQLALDGKVLLIISEKVVTEIRAVAARPKVAAWLKLTDERVEKVLQAIQTVGVFLDEIPRIFVLERDPDGSHCIDLAIAANAMHIVTRDNDLLDLMNPLLPQSQEFVQRFLKSAF